MSRLVVNIIKKLLCWCLFRVLFEHLTNLYQVSRAEKEKEIFAEDIEYYKMLKLSPQGVSPLGMDKGIAPGDGSALRDLLKMCPEKNAVIAEIGTWVGGSAAIFATELKKSGGKLICIDHWKGTYGSECRETAAKYDMFNVFRRNMQSLGLWEVISVVMTDSKTASGLLSVFTFDLVYIDADHSYEAVWGDIVHWLPNVKAGGIIAGHDYAKEYAGVYQAVNEAFGDRVNLIPGSKVWYVKDG